MKCEKCKKYMKDYAVQVFTKKGDVFYCSECFNKRNKLYVKKNLN